MMSTLNKFEDIWSKLAPRERRLALGVVIALAFLLVVTTVIRANTRLKDMDALITQLEDELVAYTELEARRVNIEQAYSKVAEQHSSEWTEAEIHNRLRQEIYRLARLNPEAPADAQQENLVEIPILRQGELRDSGSGYREYRLSVSIPPAPIGSILEFLVRLQASPQSLRIDGLELAREPYLTKVGARIDVTRTVVDGVEGGVQAQAMPQRAETWDGATIDAWKAEGFDLTLSPDINGIEVTGGCLRAIAISPGGSFGMTADLFEPGTYEVEVEALATGPAVLRVRDEATGQFLEGSADMAGDSLSYRYKLSFSSGAVDGEPVRVAVPHVTAPDIGTMVFVDVVTLRKVSG